MYNCEASVTSTSLSHEAAIIKSSKVNALSGSHAVTGQTGGGGSATTRTSFPQTPTLNLLPNSRRSSSEDRVHRRPQGGGGGGSTPERSRLRDLMWGTERMAVEPPSSRRHPVAESPLDSSSEEETRGGGGGDSTDERPKAAKTAFSVPSQEDNYIVMLFNAIQVRECILRIAFPCRLAC